MSWEVQVDETHTPYSTVAPRLHAAPISQVRPRVRDVVQPSRLGRRLIVAHSVSHISNSYAERAVPGTERASYR